MLDEQQINTSLQNVKKQKHQFKLIDKLGIGSIKYVNLLLNATTTRQYCTLLQSSTYYENIKNEERFYDDNQMNIDTSSNTGTENEQTLKKQLSEPIQENWTRQEDTEWENKYNEIFINHNHKNARIGSNYQVQEIPLCTDIQDYEYLRHLSQNQENQCNQQWDPSRISEPQLQIYLKNIEQLWPYELFYYQEDLALYYLHLKDYDVEVALISLIFNIDEIIKMLLSIKYLQTSNDKLLSKDSIQSSQKQNQRSTGQRILRERRQAIEDEQFQDKDGNYLIID